MALPTPLQDLVILAFAARTDRLFSLNDATVEPYIGALSDRMMQKAVDLPSEVDWQKVIKRGVHVPGGAGSPLLNVCNLARFSAAVRERAGSGREYAAALLRELEMI